MYALPPLHGQATTKEEKEQSSNAALNPKIVSSPLGSIDPRYAVARSVIAIPNVAGFELFSVEWARDFGVHRCSSCWSCSLV